MGTFEPIPDEIEKIATVVVDAAFKVHKVLGPGLLESVYEECLAYELKKRGIKVERQISLPIVYEDMRLDAGLRLDMLVDGKMILEIKSVEKMNPIYEAQVLTYLKLSGLRLGLLINFNVPAIKYGIKRIVL
jgi:GxxExxY protein